MRRLLMVTMCVGASLEIAVTMPAAQSHSDPSTAAATAGMDAEGLAKIRVRMKTFVDEGRIAGAVALTARHGVTAVLEAVGYQDVEAKKPMRTDTIFRVASIAKPVTAIGIMILQEDGRLTLNDPVGNYLPEFKGVRMKDGVISRRPVTIQGLITHTAGLSSEAELFKSEYMTKSLAEVVALYAQAPLDSEPGTKWLYSSPAFDTLGRIIEVVSGRPYEVFMEEQVFRPLGMRDTHFFLPPAKRDRLASFYRIEEGRLVNGAIGIAGDTPHEGRRFAAPAWGLYSTAPDLGALLQMMLSGGTHQGRRILSRASVKAMTADYTMHLVGPAQGLGWRVARGVGLFGPVSARSAYGHDGSTGVRVWVDPEKDLIGVFLKHQAGAVDVVNAFMALASAAVVE
jgi:CubicO group peptidase (beta-lactamase class C family)